jgi:DNA-directed RNA polymerase specialized sigma subunit
MTIIDERGDRVDFSLKQRIVDCVLEHRRIIGDKRWGMVQLYYRAGLSQTQVALVLGLTRQEVTRELRRAFRLVAEYLLAKEDARTDQQKVDSLHA